MTYDLSRRLAAEALGTALLVGTVVGSGIMAERLTDDVALAFAVRREIEAAAALAYVAAQIAGGIAGAAVAHLMFELPALQASETVRTGGAQWLAEVVATFGLVGTILAGIRFRAEAVPWLVGLYITAAYWFTASTSFANPAVAIARGFTDTFSGIRPVDVPGFVAAQIVGSLIAVVLFGWLLGPEKDREAPD